jgi:hypothetical protein
MKSRTFAAPGLAACFYSLLALCAYGATTASTPAAASNAPASAVPAAAPAVSGAANLYKVELIVFRHATPIGSEDYNAPAEGRGFSGKVDAAGAAPRVVRMLDESELQLSAAAAALRTGNGTQLLAHAGWVQTATGWPRHTGLPIEQTGISVAGLTGNLYLERGELLHFGANLRYGSDPAYALSELRKLRYNEKHYLDNPAFGLIVLVSPNR